MCDILLYEEIKSTDCGQLWLHSHRVWRWAESVTLRLEWSWMIWTSSVHC